MTQELVLWVLLIALVGLLWVFTCAVLTKDRSTARGPEHESVTPDPQKPSSSELAQRSMAA